MTEPTQSPSAFELISRLLTLAEQLSQCDDLRLATLGRATLDIYHEVLLAAQDSDEMSWHGSVSLEDSTPWELSLKQHALGKALRKYVEERKGGST